MALNVQQARNGTLNPLSPLARMCVPLNELNLLCEQCITMASQNECGTCLHLLCVRCFAAIAPAAR
jgi:hypothetical protein